MFNHASRTTPRDWQDRFRDISCPTLLIHGDHDPILPPANGSALAAGIPGARLEILPETGHELPPRVHPPITLLVATHGRQGRVNIRPRPTKLTTAPRM